MLSGFVAGLVSCATCLHAVGQELSVRATAEQIRVSAPQLHFLTDRLIQRLKDGNALAIDFDLMVVGEGKQTVLGRRSERFIVSYDIWEERFSVSRALGSEMTASRLSPRAAELWCLENLSLASSGLPEDRPLWVRLSIRGRNNRNARAVTEEEPLSLANLIEIFSRPGKQDENQWKLEAGPFRLRDLRREGGRAGG